MKGQSCRERKRQRGSNKRDRDVSVRSEFVCVTHPSANQWQHDSLVERQRFSLLHFDPLFIQTLHGIPETHKVNEQMLLMQTQIWLFFGLILTTALTFSLCLLFCIRKPLRTPLCRWSDARWSHSSSTMCKIKSNIKENQLIKGKQTTYRWIKSTKCKEKPTWMLSSTFFHWQKRVNLSL